MKELTQKEIEDYLMDIFYNRQEDRSRKITGARGCIHNGWIDLNSLFSCDDPECGSCVMWKQALTEVTKEFQTSMPNTNPHK